jgi:1-acyl-sn-glycerol-3-phosphate acyltransferase
MALESGAVVIPVVMVDTEKIQPIGKKIPRIHKVRIRVGVPLDFSRYDGMSGDRFVERSMTDEVMYELMLLSGQQYVDVYAAKVKAAMDVTGKTAEEVVAMLKPSPFEAAERVPATLVA